MTLRRLANALATFVLLSTPVFAAQPPVGQGAFVPVDSVPLADQLPAAPLLITAYAFVWIAVMFYVWTIWRRMNKVEADMKALSQKTAKR